MGKMKNKIAFFAIAGMVSATAFSAAAESHSATAANAMGLDVTFANQIELKAFEAQTGAAMAFAGNPLFADHGVSYHFLFALSALFWVSQTSRLWCLSSITSMRTKRAIAAAAPTSASGMGD